MSWWTLVVDVRVRNWSAGQNISHMIWTASLIKSVNVYRKICATGINLVIQMLKNDWLLFLTLEYKCIVKICLAHNTFTVYVHSCEQQSMACGYSAIITLLMWLVTTLTVTMWTFPPPRWLLSTSYEQEDRLYHSTSVVLVTV